MPKRPNPRAVKAARTYTVHEAAEALQVSVGTVRQWVRAGLPAMTSRRPYLLLGADIQDFLRKAREGSRTRLGPDQLYCLSCQKPCRPYGMLVDYVTHSDHTGRLTGLCEVCEKGANRMVRADSLPAWRKIFDVACRDEREG